MDIRGAQQRRAWLTTLLSLAAAPQAWAATTPGLRLQAEPAPLSARFAVSTRAAGAKAATQGAVWTFHRNAERIALLKGGIDEIWSRDAQGRISFERVFHEHAKVTDYSPGELATLGVAVDWAALATFVDAHELSSLRLKGRSGQGAGLRLSLAGNLRGEALRVDWLPALQLPALLTRLGPGGARTRIALLQQAAVAPAGWPQPGVRSAGYLHLDAADFGDMDYEPVVRLSEALDIRSGWRQPHQHD